MRHKVQLGLRVGRVMFIAASTSVVLWIGLYSPNATWWPVTWLLIGQTGIFLMLPYISGRR